MEGSGLVTDVLDNLLIELRDVEEPRAEIIILEANIEYMINEMLKIRFGHDDLRRNSLRSKLVVLRSLEIIPKEIEDVTMKIGQIRDIYAHRPFIRSEETIKEVELIVDSLPWKKEFGDKETFSLRDKIYSAGRDVLKNLFRIYQNLFSEINSKTYDKL